MNTMIEKKELYREYRDKVNGYVFSKLKNTNDAEDLVSEVFLKVYKNYNTFDARRISFNMDIYDNEKHGHGLSA